MKTKTDCGCEIDCWAQGDPQHTPTPWKFEEATMTIRSIPTNYWLASMNSFDGAVNNQANAAYIVRAVNAHEELLEACKYAFQHLKPIGDVRKDYSGHLAMATLSNAIAKAGDK